MRLLILGTGSMAESHAEAFGALEGVLLAGCVDVDGRKAAAFAEAHGIAEVFTSLTDALATQGFDAVANATPDAAHYETTMECVAAGVHVFCEKPLATSFEDARAMADAVGAAGLGNGVNLTYRNVAALEAARDLVVTGTLGPIRHFEASYLQSWLAQPAWGDWRTEDRWLWRLSSRHGSLGVLGDVGVHIFDFASYATDDRIASISARLKTFDKAPENRIGDYYLDANDSMALTAEMASGATGVIHATRFATGHLNDLRLRVYGEKGGLEVTNEGKLGTLRVCTGDDANTGKWRDVELKPVKTTYRRFAEAVKSGQSMSPDFGAAAQLQAVIDAAVRSDRLQATVDVELS